MAGHGYEPSEQSPSGFFVQVRFPDSADWVSVALADDRRAASARAGELFYRVRGPAEQAATHVRVISATALLATGGPGAVQAARASMADAARWAVEPPPGE